jgi:Trypsin
VAYFYSGVDDTFVTSVSGFICRGSLVSTKLVVTAANCVQSKGGTPAAREAGKSSFYMGQHYLESLSIDQNTVVSSVTQFIIHPDWNTDDERYDADIAIAVLTKTILFSNFIKPICLWTSSSDSSDLVGKTGIVAGWKKTETSTGTSQIPKWTEIQVVDLLTCIRSNTVFNQGISDRIFCAGNRVDGSGPCDRDHGEIK